MASLDYSGGPEAEISTETFSNGTNTTTPSGGGGGEPAWALYFVLVMLAIFSVVGTIGNALVVYVFSKKNDNLTSTLFIIALAVVDLMTCVIVLPGSMLMEYQKFYIGNDILCKVYQFFTTANVPYSAFIMTAIAVDRYLCICHPFLHIMNVPRARILVTLLGILAAILGLIASLFHSVYVRRTEHICYNSTGLASYNVSAGSSNVDIGLVEPYGNSSLIQCPRANESVADIIVKEVKIVEFDGVCKLDLSIFGVAAVTIYQKIHVSTFFLCIVVVSILYGLIYKSVLDRRRKRQRMKQNTAKIIKDQASKTMDCEETRLQPATASATVTINGNDASCVKHTLTVEDPKKLKRKSTRKDKNRMQNVRTAIMLFIVTVVFVVSFLPAALMANGILTYTGPIFYLYFCNNVVNPVIYSFMNKNFRDDLRKVFNCQ